MLTSQIVAPRPIQVASRGSIGIMEQTIKKKLLLYNRVIIGVLVGNKGLGL